MRHRRAAVAVVASFAALVVAARPGTAQAAIRWSVAYTLGGIHGGPTSDLFHRMSASGFGELIYPDICIPDCSPTQYPRAVEDDTKRRMFDLGYAWSPHVSAHFLVAGGPGGTVVGYREGPSGAQALLVEHHSQLVGALVRWHTAKVVRLGAGPAVIAARSKYSRDVEDVVATSRHLLPGAVADGGLALPLGAHVFVDARAQYRAFPAERFDAVTVGDGFRFEGGRASLSHRYVALGLGARW